MKNTILNFYIFSDPMVYTFSVIIVDDDSFEGEEHFTVAIVGLQNVTTAIVSIQDNEGEDE